MTQNAFDRRIYSIHSFSAAVDDLLDHWGEVRAATRQKRISEAFAERIMLAVTQVNGCRYCDYGHAKMALRAGVTQEEIDALRLGDLDALPDEEATAILFVQHYAESQGNPEDAAWQQLVQTYGAEHAQDILTYIRMITMGNLYGNTFDAFLCRFQGCGAKDSNLFQEFGVLFGGLLIVPFSMLKHWLRH